MKKIPLTNSKEFAIIDDIDLESVSQHRWGLQSHGYVRTWVGRKMIYLHRFIMKAKDGEEVDHKDRNKKNCTRKNMRTCTRIQNIANASARKKNSTGYKGVRWEEDRQKYLARIGINGKGKNLGRFKNAVDAAKAYNEAAKEIFGEFAYLNPV